MEFKMKKRVGFPRALLFYKYSVLWTTFFKELGADIIVSPKTDKKIKDLGVNAAPDEDCYSTKLYFGHVLFLKDKIDYLFIPRLGSDHKLNVGCPKFIALAEVLKSIFPDLPEIIMPYFSMAKSGHRKLRLYGIIFSIGLKFTYNPLRIIRAGRRAFQAYKEDQNGLIISEEQLNQWVKSELILNDPPFLEYGKEPLKIALIGHPYVINDEISSLSIRKLLQINGVDIITSEQMPKSLIEKQMAKLDYNMYFNYSRELLGTVMHFLENKTIDGIIQFIVFK